MNKQIQIPPIPPGKRDEVIQKITDAIREQLTKDYPDPDQILSDNTIMVNNDRA